jgi:restriction system protein
MQPGDYVITPDYERDSLYYGKVSAGAVEYETIPNDGCPYRLRRKVEWNATPLKRNEFSVPFQNTIRSSLSVFYVGQKDEFFAAIGKKEFVQVSTVKQDNHVAVLERILKLDDKEFEILVTALLSAVGFDAEHTGKVGDHGVDAKGTLNISKLASVKIYVQAKRYQLGAKSRSEEVRDLRKSIPFGGQGAFITTAGFQRGAYEVAAEVGFPRIGLVDGRDLVDLLVMHWEDIPEDFKNKLGLKPGLIPVA